jgi:hypothetical protein
VPVIAGYAFDDSKFVLGYPSLTDVSIKNLWLKLSGREFAEYFAGYWDGLWNKARPLNPRGSKDLSNIMEIAAALGLDPADWPNYLAAAKSLDIGDGCAPWF